MLLDAGGGTNVRIAILGNGSAGVMAAAHLTRHFPDFELWHVFDPDRPPIGVGEGTTAGFRAWLEAIAPGAFTAFQRECAATRKRGVRFENWGAGTEPFVHDFVPQDNTGLHISAANLPTFFERLHRATPVHGRVTRLDRRPGGVVLGIEQRADLEVDLVIDARGFPRGLGAEHLALTWIPTNAATVTRGPRTPGLERTRAVARPHGWVFVIPLGDSTSYGYVFGDDTATVEDVEADFARFLDREGIEPTVAPRTLRFPSFVCREIFDGRVCRIGNAASFIEPLEATSIALIKTELTLLGEWLRVAETGTAPRMAGDLVAGVNDALRRTVIEVSLFIGWHYAAGSKFDTPFWAKARRGFEHGMERGVPPKVRALFAEHLQRSAEFSAEEVRQARTRDELDRMVRLRPALPPTFGGMTPLGFAQVAQGLAADRRPEPR